MSNNEDYFDDAEVILDEENDAIVDESLRSALFQQDENLVSWSLENFYNEKGERRGKYSLLNNPPILRLEGSAGDRAEFVLTKELTRSLSKVLDVVDRGYYGVSAKVAKEDKKSKLTEIVEWCEEHPAKSGGALIVVILTLVATFFI